MCKLYTSTQQTLQYRYNYLHHITTGRHERITSEKLIVNVTKFKLLYKPYTKTPTFQYEIKVLYLTFDIMPHYSHLMVSFI